LHLLRHCLELLVVQMLLSGKDLIDPVVKFVLPRLKSIRLLLLILGCLELESFLKFFESRVLRLTLLLDLLIDVLFSYFAKFLVANLLVLIAR